MSLELDEELALMLLPSEEPPKRRHVAALADQLDIETWEAAALLEFPLPRILLSATIDRLKPIARELKRNGLAITALETSLLLADLDEWLVEWLEYDDSGHLHMVGGEGRVELKIGEPSLLVRGWEMRRATGSVSSSKASGSLRRVQFAHLYESGNPRPYCLIESEIRDYLFLEDELSPSARQNFESMVEILASAPHMKIEGAMLKHAAAVQGALHGLRARGADPASSTSAGLTLALIPEHVLSRIYYYNTF